MSEEMTREQMAEAIAAIESDQVARVYSGRPGCGCGCRGKYYEDKRNIKRVLTAMRTNLADAERLDFDTDSEPKVAAVETRTRYFWAYLKELCESCGREEVDGTCADCAAKEEHDLSELESNIDPDCEVRARKVDERGGTRLVLMEDDGEHVVVCDKCFARIPGLKVVGTADHRGPCNYCGATYAFASVKDGAVKLTVKFSDFGDREFTFSFEREGPGKWGQAKRLMTEMFRDLALRSVATSSSVDFPEEYGVEDVDVGALLAEALSWQ